MPNSPSIHIGLINCYGIRRLDEVLDFTNGKGCLIYAPNGTCKTSLIDTLDDYHSDKKPEDRIFKNRQSSASITDENGIPVERSSIHIFRSEYQLESCSFFSNNLIASPDLKEHFAKLWDTLGNKKNVLLNSISDCLRGKRKNPNTQEIESYIQDLSKDQTFESGLKYLVNKLDGYEIPDYITQVPYGEIFQEKYQKLLSKQSVSDHIKEYGITFAKLSSESGILDNRFSYTSLLAVQSGLKNIGYFEAGHKLIFHNSSTGEERTCTSQEDLAVIINEELDAIIQDEHLKTVLEQTEKGLGTSAAAAELKTTLSNNKSILIAAGDMKRLEQDYYLCATQEILDSVKDYLSEYKNKSGEIEQIRKQIEEERDAWDHAISIFKARFYVPYNLSIDNKFDSLFRGDLPRINFTFQNEPVEKETLFECLSTGEARALYLLNVIFEAEKIRVSNTSNQFLFFDDPVDSFDYRNKYAFIEYLEEFASIQNFYTVILTHNYDLLRTVATRLNHLFRINACFLAEQCNGIIEFTMADNIQKNILSVWKDSVRRGDQRKIIAAIPLVRELMKIQGNDPDKYTSTLSEALHGRESGKALTMNCIRSIFSEIWQVDFGEDDRLVQDVCLEECKVITLENSTIPLDGKIVLSIGIRINAERYLNLAYANTHDSIMPIYKQMGKLWGLCKELVPPGTVSFFNEAVLMSPANIHLNAFMYEPIVDMSSERLKALFEMSQDIDTMTNNK